MWRCQIALILFLATPALANQVTHNFLIIGDSFTTTAGTRIFGPYYGPIAYGFGFKAVNVGQSGTTTCEYVDPYPYDAMTEMPNDLRSVLTDAVAEGPYFAAALQWSSNDLSYVGWANAGTGPENFDYCYRAIIDALTPVTTYIFINSASNSSIQSYDDVLRQIILDYPNVYLGSEIFNEPNWEDYVQSVEPLDSHPNEAGSIFWTDQLDLAIGTVIDTNAGKYRKARR